MQPSKDVQPVIDALNRDRAAEHDPRYPPHDEEQFATDYFRRRARHSADFERVVYSGDL